MCYVFTLILLKHVAIIVPVAPTQSSTCKLETSNLSISATSVDANRPSPTEPFAQTVRTQNHLSLLDLGMHSGLVVQGVSPLKAVIVISGGLVLDIIECLMS